MAKKFLYLDGVTGLGEQEGDGWAYGPRFQVPPGDLKGVRNHVFKNQGRFFSDALGGDYNAWYGETHHIIPKDLSAGHYPWFQAGCWMKVNSPKTTVHIPFFPYRPNYYGSTWYAQSSYISLTNGQFYAFGSNPAGVYYTIQPGKWFWWEVRFYCHKSSGVVETRINDTVIKRWTGLQTIWTFGTGAPTGEVEINSSKFTIPDFYDNTQDALYDDMYVVLADTEEELDWLGKSVCEPLYPVGNGDDAECEPTGPTNFMSVKFPIEDGIYVKADSGEKDCYHFSNMEADRTRTVHGLKVTIRARKDNPAPARIRPYVRVSGTNYYGDIHYVSPEWREYIHIWDVNPNTGIAWTRSEVDSVQAGFERFS